MKLLAYTVALTVAVFIIAAASSYLGEDIPGAQSYPTALAQMVGFAGLVLGIPLAIGIAILKHNLFFENSVKRKSNFGEPPYYEVG